MCLGRVRGVEPQDSDGIDTEDLSVGNGLILGSRARFICRRCFPSAGGVPTARAHLSAQRFTGALDPATRLFEQLRRGRVGDPKVGGEAVGRSLDGGDAVGFEEVGHEVFVVREQLPVGSAFSQGASARRVDVERTFGCGTFQKAGTS